MGLTQWFRRRLDCRGDHDVPRHGACSAKAQGPSGLAARRLQDGEFQRRHGDARQLESVDWLRQFIAPARRPTYSRRMLRTGLALCITLAVGALSLMAQTPPTNVGQQVHANLNQLMRGALYPAANVVLSAQSDNPGDVKPIPGQDPSMATDPLTSTFGGWLAVENAALTLAESANLLSIPGRTCSNGVPVPTKDPVWATFVQELRDASMKADRAAQAKDQDKMIENSETLSAACAGCHRKWRDRRTPDNRCK